MLALHGVIQADFPRGIEVFPENRSGSCGHSSGTGLLRDYEKFNLLQLAGYRVLVFTPDQLARGEALAALRVLLPR